MSSQSSSFALRQIFQHERRLSGADQLTSWVIALLVVALTYALWNGYTSVQKQQRAVSAALAEETIRLKEQRSNLAAMQTGAYTPSGAYTNPANPMWMGMRHAATHAVLPPMVLAATAVGQSDLNPPNVRVTAEGKETFVLNEELENPSNLLIGSFDLSFFIIYLLPLLIIALSYNVLSGEREQGTLAMALSNPIKLATLLVGKLAFRAVLVLGGTIGITLILLFATTPGMATWGGLAQWFGWCAIVLGYGAVWFGLAAAVNTRGYGSAKNALVLVGAWMLFVVVIPALLSVLMSLIYPVASRAEMTNTLRVIQTNANQTYNASAARYAQEHADYTNDNRAGALSAADAKAAAKRVQVQDLAAAQAGALLARYDDHLLAQQRTVNLFSVLSPAILAREALNELAGTGEARYRHFSMRVDNFHDQFKGFFAPKVLRNIALTDADYDRFPHFVYAELAPDEIANRWFSALARLALFIGLCLWLTRRWLRGFTVSN